MNSIPSRVRACCHTTCSNEVLGHWGSRRSGKAARMGRSRWRQARLLVRAGCSRAPCSTAWHATARAQPRRGSPPARFRMGPACEGLPHRNSSPARSLAQGRSAALVEQSEGRVAARTPGRMSGAAGFHVRTSCRSFRSRMGHHAWATVKYTQNLSENAFRPDS